VLSSISITGRPYLPALAKTLAARLGHASVAVPPHVRSEQMTTTSSWDPQLPAALGEIRTRPLLVVEFEVPGVLDVGATPAANRRIGVIEGGRFTSEHEGLQGTVLPGGADWITVRADAVTALDVRVVLQTDAGETIAMTYTGLRHGPAETMARLAAGEAVDPSEYYFRTTPSFQTASERFDWLNRVVAVSTGYRKATGPVYHVFEVL
jgi:Protein of unknown function (DUF3237)